MTKCDQLLKLHLYSQLMLTAAALSACYASLCQTALAQAPGRFAVELTPQSFQISIDDHPFANYVFDDPVITRPYFANVHAPGGVLATRRQPPEPGRDLVDHPTFHPGIWLAFGDIGGADTWRLLARVADPVVTEAPTPGAGPLKFAMRFSYRDAKKADRRICNEKTGYEIHVTPAGYLLLWDSTFTSDREFYFGDQEEMGLGLRVATPLRAQRAAEGGVPAGNGEIVDAQGRKNEKEVWGNSADWCDYSGVTDGQQVCMTLFCHPGNFRPSWFHARDRGLLVANPFGRAAFHKGEPSKVVVKPGDELQLRYGVLVHASPEDAPPDLAAAYREYLELTKN